MTRALDVRLWQAAVLLSAATGCWSAATAAPAVTTWSAATNVANADFSPAGLDLGRWGSWFPNVVPTGSPVVPSGLAPVDHRAANALPSWMVVTFDPASPDYSFANDTGRVPPQVAYSVGGVAGYQTLTLPSGTQVLSGQLIDTLGVTNNQSDTIIPSWVFGAGAPSAAYVSIVLDNAPLSAGTTVQRLRLTHAAPGVSSSQAQFDGLGAGANGVTDVYTFRVDRITPGTTLAVQLRKAQTPQPADAGLGGILFDPADLFIDVPSGTASQDDVGYPLIVLAPAVTKTGSGTVVFSAANTYTGSTTIQRGALQLANASALGSSTVIPLAGGTLALAAGLQTTVGGLVPNAGGLTDIGNGQVTVVGGLSETDLVSALIAGHAGGSWEGTAGITSSAVAADVANGRSRAVGWISNGGGSVTVSYAALGDSNIDGQIDVLDAAAFVGSGKFDSSEPASWSQGDYTYDGIVDVLDVAGFIATGLFDAGPYNAPSPNAVAAVPEPGGLAVLLVGPAAWAVGRAALGRGRRRRP